MTREERAIQRRMTPEEKAEMRRHEKELTKEILARKRAASVRWTAMTPEERAARSKQIIDDFNARKARLNAMTEEERNAYFAEGTEKHRALSFNVG
jgi:acyl-CoA reductase-like NAD-dependent aldehyde dehydrogenase